MSTFIPPVDLVSCRENKVWLNTALDEMMFGKTKASLLLNEAGTLVTFQDDSLKFQEWKFSESCFCNEKVYFRGNFSGVTLQELIEKENSQLGNVIFKICCIYSHAIKNRITMPCNGATGILFNKENNQILFLPEKTFDKSIANSGKEVYGFYQDCWRDFVASGNDALQFSLGVLAYFACAKALPFNEEKDLKISDRNFLPLEFAVNGINKKLAACTNNLLKGKTSEKEFPLELLKREIFEGESSGHSVPEEKFAAGVKAYCEEKKNKLRRARFFRRNWPKIAAGTALLVLISVATASILHESGKKPVVIGLDSAETTKVFFRGLHTMDTDLMLAAAKDCPEAQRYISQVPQLYVSGQMRSAYNFESGISTPENWFFFEPDTTKSYSHYIYGISNFKLDGISDPLNLKVPTRKNHPGRKLYSEDGNGKIEKNPDAQHTVTYFLVHNQDNQIAIEQFTTTVTLKYIRNRWQILKLDQTSSFEIQSPLPVSLAYKAALAESKGNILKATDLIRKEFYWVPTEESLRLEGQRLDKIGY